MSKTKIYIEMSDEIQDALQENRISIADVLQQAGIDTEIAYGLVPGQEDTSVRSKEVVTIILASSAAVLAVGLAISQVVKALQRKPHLVQYDELVELRDADGNVALDTTGKPVFKRVTRYELLEPHNEDAERSFEASWQPEHGVVLKFSSAEKQLDNQTAS